ncbi:hypothetical protein IWW39_004390 [Coemansia spiralis]|uniref:SHSP domain-containing protein n=1 Tax=Coemansia spiralis TaxID=417178 RepID=A0A9W8GGI4_9FUNG|nr:hypothetical protein IWW39_004390 [Coemansia spiralis]
MNTPGVFAPAAMPRPLFCESSRPSSSSSRTGHTLGGHFAYVAGCEICEEYVCRGADICRHEHRMCHQNGYKARTEESVTDSAFANGRVRARSATTTVGDSSFGFANMESEMLRMAADNKWRTPATDDFYGKPFNHCAPPKPQGHVQLRQDNVDQVFAHHHHQMHSQRQAEMHAGAQAHFSGAHCHAKQEEEDEVKVTTTTTTTTTTKVIPCETTHCHPCTPPLPPPPPVECHRPKPLPVKPRPVIVPIIPIGTKPDGPVAKPVESCCTWCKFLPCLSCPKPTNPNARFHKLNFRLFPEYEFLDDTVQVPRPSEYFPEHTHVASRADFRVGVPKITEIAQRVYVDFIGDQMVIFGEHGRPAGLRHMHSSPDTMRSSTRSSSTRGSVVEKHGLGHGVSRVFCKNFFVPRDTYDRDRAQVFIKPNGKLKVVVPALEL